MSTLVVPAVELAIWAGAMEWMEGHTAELFGTARAMKDGTWWGPSVLTRSDDMGNVLAKWAELRKEVGVLKAKKKEGVRFKVRSADELCDKVRPEADRLGLLIYPIRAAGTAFVVEGGTLAQATITLRIQSVDDESYFDIEGFGLGADSQDKAGGKAGTYAWKTALVQALLAGGEKDTDDTDTPIAGGVKPPQRKGPPPGVPTVTRAEVESLMTEAKAGKDMEKLRRALAMAGQLGEEVGAEMAPLFKAAAGEIRS